MSTQKAPSGRESTTRRALIRATAQVMLEEGYAAATSRRVAAQAGVKPALVHYYFPSMDDLFVAVLQAGAETNLSTQQEAFAEDSPLHALWELNSAQGAALWMEFMALANHRKAIGVELKAYSERVRDIEAAAMAGVLRAHGVDMEDFPPVVMSMLLTQSARSLCNEEAVGVTEGHAEFRAFVERFLSGFGSEAAAT